MSDAVQAGVGTAHLTSELDSDGPYTISGVALGADDVTVGSSGIKKKWPAEELKDAASSLEGQPLVRDHENNTDGRVGTVTKSFYQPGVGVRYEAEIAPHYEELAQDIASGIQEVSARAYHDPVEDLEEDEESDALVVSNVSFDNLSVVSQGASPSNTAEIGGLDITDAIAMASGPQGGAVATLESGVERDGPDYDPVDTETTVEDDEPDTDSEEELAHVYDIGDLIEWGDDRLGSVTGVFVKDGVHKYEVRVLEKSGNGVEPTDETATVIAHNARRGPHVPTSDLATDEEEYSESDPDDADTEEASESDDTASEENVAELTSVAGVTFEGTSDGKLDESAIPNDDYEEHYLFPADTKTDSSYPVVDADGNLRKGNVAAAHQLGARGGVSDDELREKLMALNKQWPEGERPIDFDSDGSEENSTSVADDDTTDDDASTGQSTLAVAALTSTTQSNTTDTHMTQKLEYDTATEEDIEEMSDPVVMERDDLTSLEEKADEADELSERLDSVNSSLDELAENQEALDGVDEEHLDALQEYDEAVVLTEDEHEELRGLVDEVGEAFADELADYSPFEAEELQERFTPLELREKVDAHDEASIVEDLGESEEDPEPDGETVDTDELGDDETGDEPSEEELREAVAESLEDGKMYRQAEKVREGEISLEEMGLDPSELRD